jgi:hypothetical protein
MVFLDSHSTEALLFSPSLALSIVACRLGCCDGSPGLPPRFTRAFGHRTRGTNATVGSHCSKSIQAITANDGPLVIVYKQERGAPHAQVLSKIVKKKNEQELLKTTISAFLKSRNPLG